MVTSALLVGPDLAHGPYATAPVMHWCDVRRAGSATSPAGGSPRPASGISRGPVQSARTTGGILTAFRAWAP
ncbi:hypothetical protein GCM10010425_22630 [Streptomyces spororaveus]